MQAIRFYSSNDITVNDIRIINSPLCHLKFDDSKGIKVNNVTISSPENSPNTDGIHLQNTQSVEIQHSNIATGMYYIYIYIIYEYQYQYVRHSFNYITIFIFFTAKECPIFHSYSHIYI